MARAFNSSPPPVALGGVAFVATQNERHANGGVASLTEIVTRVRGIRPVMVTQRESVQTERWRTTGLTVYVKAVADDPPTSEWERWSLARRFVRLARFGLHSRHLLKIFRNERVRVVHCNDPAALTVAFPAASLLRLPIVLNIRDTKGVSGMKWSLFAGAANRIIVLSQEMRRHLHAHVPGLARKAIDAIYSVVDLDNFRPIGTAERRTVRQRLGISSDRAVFGVVAAVCEKKQQLELIRHLARSHDPADQSWRLYLVGDFRPDSDAYSAACLRAVKEGKLEQKVIFAGFAPNVQQWYSALDATILPSSDEGLARAMIESVACGTPVVSFRVCSASEVLEDHRCGVVVDTGDFAGLWDSARRIATDPGHRKALAEAGPVCARKLFSAEHNVAAYEQVYRSLMVP